MRNYIVLSTDDTPTTLSKRFLVEKNDRYDEPAKKSQSIEPTLDGGYDITYGSVRKSKRYTIRCRHTEVDPNFGTKADLEYFYGLNNPSGVPSSKIKLQDHLYDETNLEQDMLFIGNLNQRVLTTAVSGVNAIFRFDVEFLII